MKPLFFTKIEGTGNDFLMFDNRQGLIDAAVPKQLTAEFVKRVCDRHIGIGADGVVVLEETKGFLFAMRYFNCDGTEAAVCLNGARCAVTYARRLGAIDDKGKFLTAWGPIGFFFQGDRVSIQVLPPVDIQLNTNVTIARHKFTAHRLKVGVPHCVIFVDSFDDLDVADLGGKIRSHKLFQPDGTNVDFVKQEDQQLFVRTYERGVEAETLSCGSGAVASAYVATKLFILQSPVGIKTRGGTLVVTIKDKVYLEGATHIVCDGTFYV